MSENGNLPVHSFSFPLIFFNRSASSLLLAFSFFRSLTFLYAGIFTLLFVKPIHSQNHTLDSLHLLLRQTKNNDTLKANILNQISRSYLYDFNNLEKMKQNAALAIQLSNKTGYKKGLGYGFIYFGIYYYNQSNYDYALIYYNRSLKLLEEINDQKGMGSCYINIGSIYGTKGDYKNALAFMLTGAKIKEQVNDKRGTSAAYNNIGNMYSDQGNYPEALNYHIKSLRIKESIQDKVGISMSYNNIGLIFELQGKLDEAIAYQFKSLKIKEELDDRQGVSIAYSNIATLYSSQKKYELAQSYNFKALKIKQELGEKQGEALCFFNIGEVYAAQNNTREALKYRLKSLKIMEEIGSAKDIVTTSLGVGNTYEQEGALSQALGYYEKSLKKAKQIDYKDGIRLSYGSLATVYAKLKNYQKAYDYNNLYYQEKDSLLNKESLKQMTEINTKYQTEKKEQEIQLLTKDQQIKDKTLREQRVIKIALIIGLGLFFILSFTLYNRYRFKQRANMLLEKQKKEIQEKNILITDSIDYAQTIQEAVFPSEVKMKTYFTDSFVLYKPKAIVSGDFYSVYKKNQDVICTVADCTGHGIPGAFMSLLGFNMLENIIEKMETTTPSIILTELNNKMVATMSQNPSDDHSVKHGMDASLISINKETMELQYAGAHNPLYQIRDGKLTEIKADKISIGSYIEGKQIKFTNHNISVQEGDVFYLFSDGFPDQIGGPNRKKFYYPPFKELLVSIHTLTFTEQKEILNKTITGWKGERDQTDDILVVGIRI